jgi:uncharacterized lipoprotein YmbA
MTTTTTRTTTTATARFIVALLGWLLIPSACLTRTQVHYYTLVSKAPAAPPPPGSVRYSVRVAPASLPETLDRSELVLRISATEVAIDDSYRWAEPLRTGIARAVADSLARQLEGAQVSTSGEGPTKSDVEITVDVRRMDVRLGEDATVDVAWTARWASTGSTRTGRSLARSRSAPRAGYDGAVAACAAALDSVTGDIARSVRLEYLSAGERR